MKRKVVLLLILSIIFIPGQVKADTEKKLVEENGKYYCYINGKKQSGFQTIDGKTYFFSRVGDNAMRTGTFAVDGPYYHFDENGVMRTGIVEENGNKYYFDETGKRVSGLQRINEKTYFFSRVGDNAMRTGAFQIDGVNYRFNNDGTAYVGIYEENN